MSLSRKNSISQHEGKSPKADLIEIKSSELKQLNKSQSPINKSQAQINKSQQSINKSQFSDKSPQNIVITPPHDDKKASFIENRTNTLNENRPPVILLSEIKEVKEEQTISPRKHKILNDLMNKTPGPPEHEVQIQNQASTKEKNKEEDGVFSNFFKNIFENKKEQPQPVGLTPEQIKQSTILSDIYNEDQATKPAPKGKMAISRLLTNLNDIMEPDQTKKNEANPELENFLLNRNKNVTTSQIPVMSPIPGYSQQPMLSKSIYLPPTQLPYDYFKPQLTSSLDNNTYNYLGRQPIVRSHMNNEEVKQYLKSLDVYLNDALKKPSTQRISSDPYEKISLNKIKTSRYEENERFEHPRSSGLRASEEMEILVDNEQIDELKEKYFKSSVLSRSASLFKKNAKSMEISPFTDVKIGDIVCNNCEEFMAPEELEKHSKMCNSRVEDFDLKRVNQKIVKMKYLMIINFKNIEPVKRQSYLEMEELMNIGTIIIDEIVENNKHVKKLRNTLHDFETLMHNLPTLNNKNKNVFKVLCDRVVQLGALKINALIKARPNEPEPLRIEIPKEKKRFIMLKKVIKSGGCCGNDREEYEPVIEGDFPKISYNSKNKSRDGCCGS